MGLDTKEKENIFLQVNNLLEYELKVCHSSSSNVSALNIVMIVGSCIILIIIVFVIYVMIRRKRKSLDTEPEPKINKLINELGELQ